MDASNGSIVPVLFKHGLVRGECMRSSMMRRAALALLCGSVAAVSWAAAPSDGSWVDTWGASPDSAGPTLKAQTVRQVIRTSIGGSALRVRLSNLDGTGPVRVGPVHVALHASGSAIQPGTDHLLTFHGQTDVTLAKGDSQWSDPIAMPVAPLQELAISMYLPDATGPSTLHGDAQATTYVTNSGDATSAVELTDAGQLHSRVFLTDVEVKAAVSAKAIVAFGDSITDGYQSTNDANRRWPDILASRLQSTKQMVSMAVVNSGISGNRVLHDGVGPSALARFDRDALEKPGVHWIVLLEGINDVGESNQPATPQDDVSANQIIDGLKTLIARAHAKGIKIYGATLTPFEPAEWPYYTPQGESKREAVNAWIRNSGAFDAVIDFDKIVRDPAHPKQFLPAYDSGDHLHPNDAGYKAMADAIDLKLFKG
jgi:lysophospholipase L1-like esterase